MKRHSGGFTLIEVLVALVIVAVGMAAVMTTLSSAANTVNFLRDETFANYVALNKIATLRLSGQIPQTGNSDGDVDYANRSWHWRQEVVASQVPGINRIDFKVRPKEIKGGDDDSWYVTVSGLAGNAMAAPGTSATQVNWDPDLTGAGQQVPGGGNSGTSLTPPASQTPTVPTPAPRSEEHTS